MFKDALELKLVQTLKKINRMEVMGGGEEQSMAANGGWVRPAHIVQILLDLRSKKRKLSMRKKSLSSIKSSSTSTPLERKKRWPNMSKKSLSIESHFFVFIESMPNDVESRFFVFIESMPNVGIKSPSTSTSTSTPLEWKKRWPNMSKKSLSKNNLHDTAAIASERAENIYGLNVLADGMHDDSNNVLSVLAFRNFNLTKIKSRPHRLRPITIAGDTNIGTAKHFFEYIFHVEFAASTAEVRAQNALVQEFTSFLTLEGVG
ncbi:Prephenate dehydratase [Cynara cardunculus var. scolymus]|uniref:Prephenate dehydratase n=1 Tax=Cynara cardunculus var. scolymus TaxID=59895 RepID=A0A118JZL3_CYNCS|nr:Prephenate dehydratase [Cynara cardunculus var. scolymus]